MLTNIYENLSIIVSLSAILYSLFPVSATFCFFVFSLDVIMLLLRIKKITIPASSPPFFSVVSPPPALFNAQIWSECRSPHSWSSPIVRAAAGVSSVSMSACGDDGWTRAACRCGAWRPGAPPALPPIGPHREEPRRKQRRQRLEVATMWDTRRLNYITSDRCKRVINRTWHVCLSGRQVSSRYRSNRARSHSLKTFVSTRVSYDHLLCDLPSLFCK